MNKIIYLDAAASSLKPESVITAQVDFLLNKYANAGRGVCARASAADNMVSNAREHVAQFINAQPRQVVFTSGATDGLNRAVNIIMDKMGRLKPVVAVSDLDHHSARLPWQHLASQGRCTISVCPLDSDYNYDTSQISAADVMVITAMSNVMGVAQDVGKIVRAAREKNPNVITVVDAAQFVAHSDIDVCRWDCDFLCFSGHKIGADTGIGIMYIKNPDDFSPDRFGGGMVNRVLENGEFTLQSAPDKFEAGTLPLTQIAGMTAALYYLQHNRPDRKLIEYMYDELEKISRIKMLTSRDASLISFVVDGMHPLDFGALAGAHNICLRVGNMCASWIHARLGIDGSIRISTGPWNTVNDAKRTIEIIKDMVN